MWMNLGLFMLLWESIAVLVMAPLRLVMPEAAMADLAVAGAVTAPVALLITHLMDRYWLDCEPVAADFAAAAPQAAPRDDMAADSPRGHAAGA